MNVDGFRAITFDYRGTFESLTTKENKKFPKEHISLAYWAAGDVTSVIQHIHDRYRSHIIYIGHSIGGQLLTCVEHNVLQHIRVFIAVATQTGYFLMWPAGWQRLRMIWNWYVLIPVLAYTARGDTIALLNIPPKVAEEWCLCGRRSEYIYSDYFQALLSQAEKAQKKENKYVAGDPTIHIECDGFQKIPSLFIGIENDIYAPEKAVKYMYDKVIQTQHKKEVNSILEIIRGEEAKKIGHFGFFSCEILRDTWWRKMIYFIEENMGMGCPTASHLIHSKL
jgi:predicted alpha/beta hydrolase